MKAAQDENKIHFVKDMLELSSKMEEESAKDYNVWGNECSANADSITKHVFESRVADEERHFGQYDTELENLSKFVDNYLALQTIETSKSR